MNKTGLVRIGFVVATVLATSLITSYASFAQSPLTAEQEAEFSQNDDLFWQPCETAKGFTGEICGSNQNYAGATIFNEAQMSAIEKFQPIYEEAASKYSFPWEILAVLHYREHSLEKSNPDNGQGVYQLYSYTNGGKNSNAFLPAGPISDEEFKRQTEIVAGLINDSYGKGLDLTTDDGVKQMFFNFNGHGDGTVFEQKAAALGFSDPWEGSSYVMNRYDAQRDSTSSEVNPAWNGTYDKDGHWSSSAKDEQWGAFTAYKALTCNGPTIDDASEDTDSDSDESGDAVQARIPGSKDNASSGAQDIATVAAEIAWPKGTPDSAYTGKSGSLRYPAYVEAVQETGLSGHGHTHTPDCGDFVQTVVQYSGYDKKFEHELSYVNKHTDLWETIKWDGDYSKIQAGDIVYGEGSSHGTGKHWFVIADVDGVLYRAEASYSGKHWGRITAKISSKGKYTKYKDLTIIRAKGGGGSDPCDSRSAGSKNINGAAMNMAWPEGTDPSKYDYPGGSPNEAFTKAHKKYTSGSTDACAAAGASCDMYVSTVVRFTGYDAKYPLGNVSAQLKHVRSKPKLWSIEKYSSGTEISGGDIIIENCDGSGADNESCGHTWIAVQDEEGKLYAASASHCDRFARVTGFASPSGTAYVIKAKSAKNSSSGVSASSGVTSSSYTGTLSGEVSIGNGDIGATARYFAWPEGTPKAKYTSGRMPETKAAWQEMLKKAGKKAPFTDKQMGACCTCFVWGVLRYAGYTNVGGLDQNLYQKFTEKNGWEKVGRNLKYSELQDGDVLVHMNSCGYYPCHYAMFIRDENGKGHIAEASVSSHSYGVIKSAVSESSTVGGVVDVYRNKNNKTGGVSNDNCNLCPSEDDEDSEDGGAGLKAGGMTLSEAEKFMKDYHDAAVGKYHYQKKDITFRGALISDAGCDHGAMNNCVAFSQWFVNKYTTIGPNWSDTTNGVGMVDRLVSTKGLKKGGSGEPRPYAIFSNGEWSSAGHTGVVLGVDKDAKKIVVGEASCSFSYEPQAKEYTFDYIKKKGWTFAYTDDVLKDKSLVSNTDNKTTNVKNSGANR